MTVSSVQNAVHVRKCRERAVSQPLDLQVSVEEKSLVDAALGSSQVKLFVNKEMHSSKECLKEFQQMYFNKLHQGLINNQTSPLVAKYLRNSLLNFRTK
jgi:hypothetical protein